MPPLRFKTLEEFSTEIPSFHESICILEERSSGRILFSRECSRFWELQLFDTAPTGFSSFLIHFHDKIRNYAEFSENVLKKNIQESIYFETLIYKDWILRLFWKDVLKEGAYRIRLYTFEVLAREGELEESEKHKSVESIFYKLPQPAILFDPSTLKILSANDAAIYLYGYSRNEFGSLGLLDIRPEEDRADLDVVLKGFASENGIQSRGIWRHWRKDKKILYMKISANRIVYGDSFAVLAVLSNVSDVVETNYALKQNRDEKQSIIESMSDRYFSLSKDWRFISANKHSLITLGKTKEELIGKNIWDLYPEAGAQFFREKYELAAFSRKPVLFEFKNEHTGNIIEFRVFPFEEGLSVFFQDITEVRRRETEQNILKEISMRIPKASTVKESFEILFEVICRETSWKFAQTWKYQNGELILEENASWHSVDSTFLRYRILSFDTKFKPGDGLIGKVFSTDKTYFSGDIQKETDFKRTRQAIQSGVRSWIAVPLKTGHESYVLEFCTHIKIDSGESYIQMFELISDQIEVLFRNKEAEEEKDQFFKLSGDMFQISAPDGKVIERNQAWEEILGYSTEELSKFDISEIIYPDDREKMIKIRDKFRKDQQNISEILRYVAKDGQVKSILWKVTFSKEHRLVYTTGKDITDMQKTQLQLETLAKELKRSNADLEDFAFIASHDLQEPLRKIMAFGDRLLKKNAKLDPESLDYLQRMASSANRLSKLIEGLLSYSRIKTRAKPFRNSDLTKVLKETIGDLEIYIKEKNAKVVDCKVGFARCDPAQIGMVFQNLIKNGLKFNKSKIPEVIIQCVPHPTERKWIQITFFDNGIGFDKKHEEKIFTLFQRLHAREDFEGNGIGLAVCKKIIELHGGRIYAQSKLGEGSTFYVDLPGVLNTE
ncbi:PAS domain S-box protein [Leptospira stimsonii]|uniref:histidine kinase n=1 Tax=Leptospira stimsonii TaxID=2202203 RepID=A0ABY2MZF5_9LEPT|nr:PAS domain S-box protein [Leptospira stimsonii]TGK17736.1 PAS domain S-box protein [Leptospira stimsonii]TGM12579.1 PAS domain S-box protein [Leptospira stimsonii]